MALWRDPLDELIADLERTLPTEAESVADEPLGSLVGLQTFVAAILYGTEEQQAQAERDPRVQAYWKWCRGFAPSLGARKAGDP